MDRQERMKIEKEKASHIRYLIDKATSINKAKSDKIDDFDAIFCASAESVHNAKGDLE